MGLLAETVGTDQVHSSGSRKTNKSEISESFQLLAKDIG